MHFFLIFQTSVWCTLCWWWWSLCSAIAMCIQVLSETRRPQQGPLIMAGYEPAPAASATFQPEPATSTTNAHNNMQAHPNLYLPHTRRTREMPSPSHSQRTKPRDTCRQNIHAPLDDVCATHQTPFGALTNTQTPNNAQRRPSSTSTTSTTSTERRCRSTSLARIAHRVHVACTIYHPRGM